jgi:hypothetical protein
VLENTNDERTIRALELLTAQVWSLRQQTARLEERLAFALPTDADVRNEVDRFITRCAA